MRAPLPLLRLLCVVLLAAVVFDARADRGDVEDPPGPQTLAQQLAARKQSHLARLHRKAHALAAQWRGLSPAFVFVTPASVPGQSRQYVDTRGCTEVAKLIEAPLRDSGPGCRELGGGTPLFPDFVAQYGCSQSDLMTTDRFENLQASVTAGFREVSERIQVQSDARTLAFTQGVTCGGVNITGLFTGNVVVVVTAHHTWYGDEWTSGGLPCRLDETSGRPLMVHMNFDPRITDHPASLQTAAKRMALHALAFNTQLINEYRFPYDTTKTWYDFDPVTFTTGPVTGDAVSMIQLNATRHVQLPCAPIAGRLLGARTLYTLTATREYFGCPSADQMPFDDLGYHSGLLYWEKRLLRGEIMTVTAGLSTEARHVSKITVAFLEDTGWYKVSSTLVTTPESGAWGHKLGCGFMNDRCSIAWPRSPLYFCEDFQSRPTCGFDRSFTGKCNAGVVRAPLPGPYINFDESEILGGADIFADACPYVAADPNTVAGGFCAADPSDGTSVDQTERGSRRSLSSLCYTTSVRGSHRINSVNDSTVATCFDTTCFNNTLYVRVGDHFVECDIPERRLFFRTPRSGNATVPDPFRDRVVITADFVGMLECPPANDIPRMCGLPGTHKPNFWPSITGITPDVGRANGGMTFTVAGENLVNCKAVAIGGVVAPVLYHFPTGTLQGRTRFVDDNSGSVFDDGLGAAEVELWCIVAGACPDGNGCGVSRLSEAFTITELLPCNATDDVTTCKGQPACEWIGSQCIERLTTLPPTPAPTPAPPPSAVDDGCFSAAPRMCSETGKCAPELSLCLRCPSPFFYQCWDGFCVLNQNECTCRPDVSVRCSDGSCAPTEAGCSIACGERQTMCWDKTCVDDPIDCRCPPVEPIKCNITGRCGSVLDSSWCSRELRCPTSTPVLCWDSACAFSLNNCQCDIERPQRCQASGSCIEAIARCPCPSEFPVDCGATVGCLPAGRTCPSSNSTVPCALDQFRCASGECVTHVEDCTCADKTTAIPMSQIIAPTTHQALSAIPFRLVAATQHAPCRIDLQTQVDLTWEVTPTAGTAIAPLPIPDSHLKGTVAVLRPGWLTPNGTYRVSLTARSRVSQRSVSTFTLVQLQQRVPVITINGAHRDIDQRRPLVLTANIAFDDDPLLNQVRWTCCVGSAVDPNRCETVSGATCPALFATITGVSTPSVSIQAIDGLPNGRFLFSASYRGVASALVPVTVKPVAETCLLYTPRDTLRSSDSVLVHVVVETLDTSDPNVFFSVKWSMNGSTIAGQTGLSLSLAGDTLPPGASTTITASITSTRASASVCSKIIVPRPPVTTGVCTVANTDPTEDGTTSTIGIALQSPIRVAAFAWDVPSLAHDQPNVTRRTLYRFGYLDLAQRATYLSQAFTETPQLLTVPPVLPGNPSLVQIRFFVEAVEEEDDGLAGESPATRQRANTTCTFNVKALPDRTMLATVRDLQARINTAVQRGPDFGIVLGLVLQVLGLIDDADVSSAERRRILSVSLLALKSVIEVPYYVSYEMSVAERTLIFSALQRITEHALPGASYASNAGTRLAAGGAVVSTLLDSETATFVSVLRSSFPMMLRDSERFRPQSVDAADAGGASSIGSTGSSAAAASAAASSAVMRTAATVRQRVQIHKEDTALLRMLNWIGQPAATSDLYANLADAVASERSLASGSSQMTASPTRTAGEGPLMFFQRALVLHRADIRVTGIDQLTSLSVSIPEGLVTTLTGSHAAMRVSGLVSNEALGKPFNVTAGMAPSRNGDNSSDTTDGLNILVLPPQTLSPTVRVQALVEESADPVTLTEDLAVQVTFQFMPSQVPEFFSSQNVSCMELAIAGNGSYVVPAVPSHLRVDDVYDGSGVGRARWIDSGEPVFSQDLTTASCSAWSATRGLASLVVLVARAPQIDLETPAPTEVQLLASLSNLASSVSPAVWAAAALGGVVFLLGVGYGIYRWRTRQVEEVAEEEVKEKSQLVLLGELLQTDPDLRISLEVARARRINLADL